MAASRVYPIATALPSIFYEDPEPVEDGLLQESAIFEVVSILKDYFRDDTDTFVSGGGFIFYDPSNGNRRIAPDLFIAFDVDVAGIRANLPNYLIWEVGKPPDFALEVASPSTADNDLGSKRDLYAQLGITEYWRLDSTGGDLYGQPLSGERLVDGVYRPLELNTAADGTTWAYSEILDLRFHWGLELRHQFDVRDPRTGLTVRLSEVERQARLAVEDRLAATEDTMLEERSARRAAESRETEERSARRAAESRETEERSARRAAESREMEERAARRAAESRETEERAARRAAESREMEERAAAESRERELRAEIERLRRQLPED